MPLERPASLLGSNAEVAVAEAVGIGVVGTGDWGANLVRNFASLPGARLRAL